jgi:hypothetical protein
MTDLLEQVMNREWFYRFQLPDGRTVPTYHGDDIDLIHDTRWRMLEHALDQAFPGGFGALSAVDLASHQGWFASQLSKANLRNVLGIDARASHVADARLINQVLGHDQLRFEQSDIFDLDTDALGQFDVVLMLGLLYHLENPVGALRIARALCRTMFVIETQVVPGISGMVDYGSYRFVRPLTGSFGMVDESAETDGPEASVTGVCLIPNVEGLVWLLHKVGFSRVELLRPPADAYEQLLYGKRVMVAAWV